MSLTVTSASFDSKKASYCLYNKASRTDLYFVDHGNGTVDSYETVYITTAFNGSKPAVLGPGQKEEIERAIASYNAGILDMLSKMASGELRVKYDTDTYRKVELASRCEQPSYESHLICRDQDNASLTGSAYCDVVYPLYVEDRNKRVEVRTLKATVSGSGLKSEHTVIAQDYTGDGVPDFSTFEGPDFAFRATRLSLEHYEYFDDYTATFESTRIGFLVGTDAPEGSMAGKISTSLGVLFQGLE